MFMRWCYWSHLVLPCTNGHPNKPIFSCLCLWGGAFTRILYFRVQTGTKTNLFLVVYVQEVVLLLASCTSMYKQAPKHTYLQLFMFMRWCFWSHLVCPCTNGHQNKPIFSCLCLWGGAFTRILYFDVQTGTKTYLSLVVCVYGQVLLVAFCTSVYKHASKTNLSLVVCVYGEVLLVAFCTSVYKHASKTNISLVVYFWGWCFQLHFVLRCTSRHQKQTYLQLFMFMGWCFRVYFKRKTAVFKSHFTPAQNCVCSLKTS